MKALAYIIAVIVLFSCNNEQFEQCKEENERLIAEKNRRDSVIRNLSRSYARIDSVSIVIATKKAYINELAISNPLTREIKDEIIAQIDTINMLMDENKSTVTALSKSGLEEGFKYMVQSMDEKNSYDDSGVNDMKKDLAAVSKDFSDLFEEFVYQEAENIEMKGQLSSKEAELAAAQERLEAVKEKLHSGWYIIGTRDDLKEKGLIYKKGIFDIKEVNKDFDKSLFKKVDIYELKEVLLDAKRAEIMTTHPTESYEVKGIKKKVSKLVIKEPELFWSVSKFLIIEVEN